MNKLYPPYSPYGCRVQVDCAGAVCSLQADGGLDGEERLVGDHEEIRLAVLHIDLEGEDPAGDCGGDGGARSERHEVHVHGFGFEVVREDVFEHPGALAVHAEIMDVEAADWNGSRTGEEVDVGPGKERDVREGEDGGLRGELERDVAEGLRVAAEGNDGGRGILLRIGDGDLGTELLAGDVPEDRGGSGKVRGLRGSLDDGGDRVDDIARLGKVADSD